MSQLRHNQKKITLTIGDTVIGDQYPTWIIAEIGINHNGDPSIARELIDVAAEAGVNAVKFQKRSLEHLYSPDVLENTGKYEQTFQYMIPLLKTIELEAEQLKDLKQYSESKGLTFLCTPFDSHSADLLESMDVSAYKIASADLNNFILIDRVADTGKPLIVSTGMSYWNEIELTVSRLKKRNASFALLHCRSSYPVWPREVNLKMIDKLREFNVPVGYSGHDIGITIPLVAASMGACIIEKHITLDRNMSGPDHKISLEPYELKRMVRDIRVADQAMGKENRFLLRGEILNRELFGKSLVANCEIHPGDTVTEEMISVIGPGKGLSPSRLENLVGRAATRIIAKGECFTDEDITGTGVRDVTNGFRSRWGFVARYDDVDTVLEYNPRVIEFHFTENDLARTYIPEKKLTQSLVVHAPEYMGDKLFDLCAEDESLRNASVRMANETIAITERLAPYFNGSKPKVIVHPGAMSLNTKLDPETLKKNLQLSLRELKLDNIELLLENLPPYPWYFGGAWKGNYFMSAESINVFCRETGVNICFDLSHAALYCNAKNKDLCGYIETIYPYIRHIHFADGYGLDGEGVQIGEGDIDLDTVMPLFSTYSGTWIPEIWRGHLDNCKGFVDALGRLSVYDL